MNCTAAFFVCLAISFYSKCVFFGIKTLLNKTLLNKSIIEFSRRTIKGFTFSIWLTLHLCLKKFRSNLKDHIKFVYESV